MIRDTREIPTPYVTIPAAEFEEITELAVSVANGIVLECEFRSSLSGKKTVIEPLEPALKLRDMTQRIKKRCIEEWEEN